MRLPATAAAALALLAAPALAQPAPRFDAIVFFTGTTEGHGTIKVAMHHRHAIRVHGRGRVLDDGTLLLAQTVEEEGRPSRTRTWRIRRVAPGRYAGTLSDATGPVTGESAGDRLHLAFHAKGGIAIEQWLTLAPDGRGAQNRLVARKLGLRVARLDETIRKGD